MAQFERTITIKFHAFQFVIVDGAASEAYHLWDDIQKALPELSIYDVVVTGAHVIDENNEDEYLEIPLLSIVERAYEYGERNNNVYDLKPTDWIVEVDNHYEVMTNDEFLVFSQNSAEI